MDWVEVQTNLAKLSGMDLARRRLSYHSALMVTILVKLLAGAANPFE